MEPEPRLRINAFLAEGGIPEGVRAHRIALPGLVAPPQETYRTAWGVARQLTREFGGYAAVTTEGGFTVIYSTGRIPVDLREVTIMQGGRTTTIKVKHIGEALAPPHVVRGMVDEALKARLRSLGYRRFRNLHYLPRSGKIDWSPIDKYEEPYYVYDGVRYSLRALRDDLIVFIDPKTVRLISLLEYYRKTRHYGVEVSKALVVEGRYRIKGRVVVAPYFKEGRIHSVDDIMVDEGPDFMLERLGMTLKDYWQDYHGVTLPEDDFPVRVETREGGRKLIYPASKVFPTTRELKVRKMTGRMPSRERYRRTVELAREIFSDAVELGGRVIRFRREMLSVGEGGRRGLIDGVGVLKRPYLLFGGRGVDRVAKRGLERYGPYSGPISISVVYVVPESFARRVEAFHGILAGAFERYRLGELRLVDLIQYRSGDDMRAIGEEIDRRLGAIDDPKIGIAVVLRDDDKWEILKGGEGRKYLQFCRVRTLREMIGGRDARFRNAAAANLVTQIYFKASPLEDRSPWILADPADRSGSTVYVGFDVSRRWEGRGNVFAGERTEAHMRASICDPKGAVIRMKVLRPMRGESLGSTVMRDLLYRVMREAGDALGQEPRRIVMMKDGRVTEGEKELISGEIRRFSSEKGVRIELYSVEKRIVERVYSDTRALAEGTYVRLADGSLLLITSLPPGGHPQPLRISKVLEAPSGSGPTIEEFAREFYELSHLHWHSLFAKIRTALPLKVVQEIGLLATKYVDVPEVVGYPPL